MPYLRDDSYTKLWPGDTVHLCQLSLVLLYLMHRQGTATWLGSEHQLQCSSSASNNRQLKLLG